MSSQQYQDPSGKKRSRRRALGDAAIGATVGNALGHYVAGAAEGKSFGGSVRNALVSPVSTPLHAIRAAVPTGVQVDALERRAGLSDEHRQFNRVLREGGALKDTAGIRGGRIRSGVTLGLGLAGAVPLGVVGYRGKYGKQPNREKVGKSAFGVVHEKLR